MQLLPRVVTDRLVGVEEPRFDIQPVVPPARRVAGDAERALAEGLAVVVQLGEVQVGHRAQALAARAHPPGTGEGLPHGLAGAPLDRDRTARPDRGHVEGEGVWRAHLGLAETAEEDAQHGVGVGGRADRRADVAAHPLLVHHDRRGQPLEHVHLGTGEARHEALDERAVGLVDQLPRLGRDGVEHERALPWAGHPREDGQPALGDLEAHLLEVVLACPVHTDHLVPVGRVRRRPGRPPF